MRKDYLILILYKWRFQTMSVTKKPDLSDPILRAKLAKGMGHNYYGEVRTGG